MLRSGPKHRQKLLKFSRLLHLRSRSRSAFVKDVGICRQAIRVAAQIPFLAFLSSGQCRDQINPISLADNSQEVALCAKNDVASSFENWIILLWILYVRAVQDCREVQSNSRCRITCKHPISIISRYGSTTKVQMYMRPHASIGQPIVLHVELATAALHRIVSTSVSSFLTGGKP